MDLGIFIKILFVFIGWYNFIKGNFIKFWVNLVVILLVWLVFFNYKLLVI